MLHPDMRETSGPSASVIVPMLMDLVTPRSVLDVGCGSGAWLEAFGSDVSGLGIDQWPETPLPNYQVVDLTQSFEVGRYDLALCLEVAEHLPETSARALIASLVRAAPVVAFAAAIPGQPGTGHINCQWPDYWQALFAEHEYRQFDVIRSRIWDDDRVAGWFSQNLFLYSAERHFEQESWRIPVDRVIHPWLLEYPPAPKPVTTSALMRELPAAIGRTFRDRFRRLKRRATRWVAARTRG